ncbi:MAG TPA: hypothetical protein VLE97_10960 [Gaiellaceae bacterium]|nr:hypothetical protein [Gaiellaceae bacterium]
MSTDWWSAGQRWLEQQALKESAAQKRAWVKAGRSAKTFRYDPPEWHRDAVAALGRNDEETFKAIKLGQLGTQGLPPLARSRHATKKTTKTKKSPAQLQREIDEALARPAAKSAAVIVYSRPSGYWYAQAHDATGKRVSDATGYSRDDVLRALRGQYAMMGVTITSVKDEDPYATSATQHATKRGARSKGPPVVGSHGLGTADVRTQEGAYWIVTRPNGYRVDYKAWGPSNEEDLGTFVSRRQAQAKIVAHAGGPGAIRHAKRR